MIQIKRGRNESSLYAGRTDGRRPAGERRPRERRARHGRRTRHARGGVVNAVTAVSIVPSSGRAEVVVALSGPVDVSDFVLSGPDRVVLDLTGARLGMPPAPVRQGLPRRHHEHSARPVQAGRRPPRARARLRRATTK